MDVVGEWCQHNGRLENPKLLLQYISIRGTTRCHLNHSVRSLEYSQRFSIYTQMLSQKKNISLHTESFMALLPTVALLSPWASVRQLDSGCSSVTKKRTNLVPSLALTFVLCFQLLVLRAQQLCKIMLSIALKNAWYPIHKTLPPTFPFIKR